MAHTPGPWEVRRSKMATDGAFDYAISSADTPVIAEAFGRDANGGWPNAEANARLIAAAPEMLEALQACARILPHYHMRGETTGHDESLTAVLERVQEAIALATGKDRDFGGKGKGGHHGKR